MTKIGDALAKISQTFLVNEELRESRLKICETCPLSVMKKFSVELNICSSCGCVIPHKVKLKHASCPENKW